jgi:uncharacterized protein YbjT (DUF2867 family)
VRILVTGPTGNVGSAVCAQLLEHGASVVAAVSGARPGDPETAGDALHGVERVSFDFENPESFGPAVAGCDGLFLLRPPAISKVGPTLNHLVDVAAEAGVRHVTFLSVAGAENNRLVPHHRVEQHLTGSDRIGWTILRPGFFAQNITGPYRDDIHSGRIVVPAGDGRVAFVDARDLGEVAALTLLNPADHAGEGYHLTGPRAWSFEEVAALLSDVLKRPIRYEPASAVGYFNHLRKTGLPLVQIVVQTILHLGLRKGDAEEVDPTLPELLGRPATTLEQFAADCAGKLTRGA